MIEPVRIVADWLADASHGVNSQLPLVARDAGDAQPPDVTVQDETRDAVVARGQLPDTTDAERSGAYVVVEGFEEDLGQETLSPMRYGSVTLLLRYKSRTPNTAAGRVAEAYTMRAVVRSLTLLHDDSQQDARSRNGVNLVACTGIKRGHFRADDADSLLTSGLLVTYQIEDTATGLEA